MPQPRRRGTERRRTRATGKGEEDSQAAHAETVAATEKADGISADGLAVPRLDVADIRTFGGAGREPGHRGGVQRRHPLPENDGIIGDKRKAYEQAQAEKQQAEKVRSLEDFAFSEESDTDGVEMELPDSEPEREPFRDYSGKGGGSRSSVTAYRDINRRSARSTRSRRWTGKRRSLKRQVEEPDRQKLEERERQAGGIDDQVALMEKSYELAAKYMGQNRGDGVAVQVPATGQDGNGLGQPAVAVQAARERTVSGLQQPLSDAEFMRRYSQPRNYGFNTAVGSGYAMGKNTIRACIHGDQTIMDGQTVKLRLLEPLQAGNLVIPQNTLVAGTGKVQGNGWISWCRPSNTGELAARGAGGV